MKIHLVSDTHVDHYPISPTVQDLGADMVILAGDIGDPHKRSYRDYISEFSKLYKTVILQPANP